jgi:hypothetical protein
MCLSVSVGWLVDCSSSLVDCVVTNLVYSQMSHHTENGGLCSFDWGSDVNGGCALLTGVQKVLTSTAVVLF